jgi:ribose transport system ATP-binding protein
VSGERSISETIRGERSASVPATLALTGLRKSFGGVQALKGVDLTIRRGEVHGLVGENGSGKSTLIKTLAGYHAPDAGRLEVNGEPVPLPLAPGGYRAFGFEFVHQDLGLVESLSVVENLFVGEIATSDRRWHISWRALRLQARELFERYGLDLDPAAKIADLAPVEKALVAILRAIEAVRRRAELASDDHTGLLVLDEPTVFLPRTGVEELFTFVREITTTGVSVLFVSHHLDEVREVTDRVTVLRDGERVGTVDTARVSEPELVKMIIGRDLGAQAAGRHRQRSGGELAQVRDLTGDYLDGVSLDLREGEVLGLTGLVGSGFEEAPYLLFGAHRAQRGTLALDGRTHVIAELTPERAMDLGMALVPADRQRDASLPTLSIADNVTMLMLAKLTSGGRLHRRQMEAEARSLMDRFDIRPPDPRPVLSSLSGGNQQKVVLAKWFVTGPRVLLLHEPTQGVDVGAREQIFGLVAEAAARGMAVICASADYEQLEAICSRVLVIGRGRVVSDLEGAEITRDRIAEQCYQSVPLDQDIDFAAGAELVSDRDAMNDSERERTGT